jgi:hypothetical protein
MNMNWDVFISHASEDKESFARPLAEYLRTKGLRVWYDEFALRFGDSLRRSIDNGLRDCRLGVLVLSPYFFAKEWPQRELDGLVAREVGSRTLLFPIWHGISREQVATYSPTLADRVALSASVGLEGIADAIMKVLSEPPESPSLPHTQDGIRTSGTSCGPSRSSLRILYFQDQPRSAGLACRNSTRLVDELRRRTHDVRLCWAVHPPLKDDWSNVNDDLIHPDTVREWQPQALVFEAGLFRGEPRIPLELLDELESSGSVALIELNWHEIWNIYTNPNGWDDMRTRLEAFLSSRDLALLTADDLTREHPLCKSRHGRYLMIEAEELRTSSAIRDEELFLSVRRIAAPAAVPLRWASGNLAMGGPGTYIKAYNSRFHEELNPQFGVLYDKHGRTEAIFTGNLIWDGADEEGDFDNHIYLANLIEVLHHRRSQLNQIGW